MLNNDSSFEISKKSSFAVLPIACHTDYVIGSRQISVVTI